ncbi:hypothetical protein CC78DRAFT_27966 [Lojkania enalia]|uniref:Uncharacterized protein n=1 Tax=Lojkania enalia TaxID=147567 RepID=A0A9P4K320_9PLEO|nr:hypothetical protein CC78DRAFT_27966 [Didymosphaeria enalia]
MFNTYKYINVRAYIASFNNYTTRILYIDRLLTTRIFGCYNNTHFLANFAKLGVRYIILNKELRISKLI